MQWKVRQSTPSQAICFARQATNVFPVPVMPAQAARGCKRARAVPGPQKRRASAPLQTRKRVPTRPHHCAGESTLLESLLEDFVTFLVFLSSFFYNLSSFFLSLFVFFTLLSKLPWPLPLAPARAPPHALHVHIRGGRRKHGQSLT